MILSKRGWDVDIELDINEPKSLVVRDLDYFYIIQKELLTQNEGKEGTFAITNNLNNLNFETEVLVINDVMTISINTKKILNYIYKDVAKEILNSQYAYEIVKINTQITNFINIVKNYTFRNLVQTGEQASLEDFFKLFGVKLFEEFSSISLLLYKYLELIFEIGKVKIIFISLALYLLTKDQVLEIIKFCKQNNKIIVFLDRYFNKNEFSDIIKSVNIDKDIIFI
jgi:CRISPR type II-A-associated protein Csn2